MPEAEKTAVLQHFDRYAPQWGSKIREHAYHSRYLVVGDMVRRIGPPAFAIDVGCGTGDYCTLFDPARTRYVGVDISPQMIEQCRAVFPKYEFRVGDGDTLEFPDNTADLVLDVAVIEYYEDPMPHLRELARVTKPGGSVIVVGPNGANVTRRWADAVDRGLKWLAGRAHPQAQADHLVQHRRRDAAELRRLGAAAGLRLVEHEIASIYLFPVVRPAIANWNTAISKRISGRPGWRWLTAWSGTNLICRFEKAGTARG